MFNLKKALTFLMFAIVSLSCIASDFEKQIIGSWLMVKENSTSVDSYYKDGTYVGRQKISKDGKLSVDRRIRGQWKIVDGVIINNRIAYVKSKRRNWKEKIYKKVKKYKIVSLADGKLVKSHGKSNYETTWLKQKPIIPKMIKGLNQGIFGVKYGSEPTDDMTFSGESDNIKWYEKFLLSSLVEGVEMENIYYGYNEEGFIGVSLTAKGSNINDFLAMIYLRYGKAPKSKVSAFRVAHIWNMKNFNISMDANYTRGQGTFAITHIK